MRLRSAANNQATRRNEIIKSYLQLGSSSNRYAPRLPQQETKSSTKQLAPMDPILGPENLLKTGFAQKGLPSCPSGRHKPQSFIETKRCASATLIQKTSKNEPKHGPKMGPLLQHQTIKPPAKIEIIKSNLQLQAATDMHPACPNKKQNHLQNSLLRWKFWVRKTFSKPASLKRASLVALPVAISHKASLKPNVALPQP